MRNLSPDTISAAFTPAPPAPRSMFPDASILQSVHLSSTLPLTSIFRSASPATSTPSCARTG